MHVTSALSHHPLSPGPSPPHPLLTPSSAFTPPSPLRGRTSSCSTSSKSHAPCGVLTPGSTKHSPAQVVNDAAPAGREGEREGGILCTVMYSTVFHLMCSYPFPPSFPLFPPPLDPPSLPPSPPFLPLSLLPSLFSKTSETKLPQRRLWVSLSRVEIR